MPRSQTWAELRVIRRDVKVALPVKDEGERAPYPRERLVDGEMVKVASGGLAWVRRDGGATLLVKGPAELTMRSDSIEVAEGRVFIDTPPGVTAELKTPNGPLHLAEVRASIDVTRGKQSEAYVLAGEVRADVADRKSGEARAGAGEKLTLTGDAGHAVAKNAPVLSWEDWTGGLATTDRAAEPSPFGIGTVGARRPGDQGSPRFPLAIQKLDVKVTIDHDFAITEVDELFFNPSSEVVEGMYRFRTPDSATLARFGVDRQGAIVWGRVKEKAAAAAQYQSNVYQGSTEDPALLEWDAPGVYHAKLYPIGPGETRRVVVRYSEWLGRTGAKGERRLYVYPMAAEGLESSLPHIEELTTTVDVARAGASEIRCGMAGVREGDRLVVREHDVVPRADLAVELFDAGQATPRGYTAAHVPDLETLPPDQRGEVERAAKGESDYIIVPVRSADVPLPQGGIDLAIVVDTSAATEKASIAIARAATAALLAHLGKDDRVVVWAGDSSLRPVVAGKDSLQPVDEAARRAILAGLAGIDRGGATDLGAMLEAAARKLDPARRGAVVYIGDGAPTVGELSLADLRDKMAKLPRPVRVFGLGVGDGADMAILKGLSRGSFAERIGDANAAARAALRLLEAAEHPAWLGASVDLGQTVERVYPRDLGAMVEGETALVIGRLTGAAPASITLKGPGGADRTLALSVEKLDDRGDLRRRWADGRLAQMIDEGTGRAAMVDLGSRHGIITPVTSLYVPTYNEMTPVEKAELAKARQLVLEDQEKQQRKIFDRGIDHEGKEADGDDEREETKSQIVPEDIPATRAKGEETSTRRASPARGARPSGGAKNGDMPTLNEAPPPPPAQAVAAATAAPMAPGAAPSAMPSSANEPAYKKADKGTMDIASEPADEKAAAPREAKVAGHVAVNDPTALAKPVATPTATSPAKGGDGFGYFGPGSTTTVARPPAATDQLHAELKTADDNGRFRASEGEKDAIETPDVPMLLDTSGSTSVENQISVDGVPVSGELGGLGLVAGGPGGGGRADTSLRPQAAKQKAKEPIQVNGKAPESLTKESGLLFQTTGSYATQVAVHVDDLPHAFVRCGGAASAPFEDRILLWRERLMKVTSNAWGVANVYRSALASCEAPTWRERSKLLSLCLDAMPQVSGRVQLWRVMFNDLGAADALYRGILARVKTPQEIRQLHDALGLKSIDPQILAKVLKDAKTPEERVKKLRALVLEWPDDFTLALRLLDMLEDVSDDAGARQLGRTLRARPDADARLRTAVGELYLRLSARDRDAGQKAADEAEARRAFGEIVEFAPDDPVARRRLGDLLRAHGWYAEAARQYETLAKLAPDDVSVALLLAASAEGLGKLEEAVKWTEKGGASGAPDAEQSPARTARAIAATYLAWGRLAALEGGRKDEAAMLATRRARVLSTERSSGSAPKGTRVTLTWSHPELHPTLWNNSLGAMMPAPDGDVTMGVAQAHVPDRPGAAVEVRIEADEVEHAARLGAVATLTVVFDEGADNEKIVRMPLTFQRDGAAVIKLSVAGGEVKR